MNKKIQQSSPTQDTWQKILQKYPEANFLQSPPWAETQRLLGFPVMVQTLDAKQLCLGIVRSAKRGRYLEVAAGPLVDWSKPTDVQALFRELIKAAKAQHCVFIRFRPQLEDTPVNRQLFETAMAGFAPRPALMHLAAQNTVILDLTKTTDDLLMAFRRQTRYEVRRAGKLNITVTEDNSLAALRNFYELQQETAKRQNFVPPSYQWLEAERTAFGDHFHLFRVDLPGAANEPTVLAYGLFLAEGREVAYYEAASSLLSRQYPGAYALIWHSIQYFKAAGYERLNLFGIAPPGVEHHRYSGVTTFKTGFGGQIINYLPAQDLVLNPLRYQVTRLIEQVRKRKRKL